MTTKSNLFFEKVLPNNNKGVTWLTDMEEEEMVVDAVDVVDVAEADY